MSEKAPVTTDEVRDFAEKNYGSYMRNDVAWREANAITQDPVHSEAHMREYDAVTDAYSDIQRDARKNPDKYTAEQWDEIEVDFERQKEAVQDKYAYIKEAKMSKAYAGRNMDNAYEDGVAAKDAYLEQFEQASIEDANAAGHDVNFGGQHYPAQAEQPKRPGA